MAEPRIAGDYAPQPPVTNNTHPRYREWLTYRGECASNLISAQPFESWLSNLEDFENGETFIFEVTCPDAELDLGWYKGIRYPGSQDVDYEGPFNTKVEAEQA